MNGSCFCVVYDTLFLSTLHYIAYHILKYKSSNILYEFYNYL